MAVLDRMLRLDRRWIFLFVGVAVTVPLFLKVQQKIEVTPETRGDLRRRRGAPARIEGDAGRATTIPASAAEIQPMAIDLPQARRSAAA